MTEEEEAGYYEGLALVFSTTAKMIIPVAQKRRFNSVQALFYTVGAVAVLLDRNMEIGEGITYQEVYEVLGKKHVAMERAIVDFLGLWEDGKLDLQGYPFTLEETVRELRETAHKADVEKKQKRRIKQAALEHIKEAERLEVFVKANKETQEARFAVVRWATVGDEAHRAILQAQEHLEPFELAALVVCVAIDHPGAWSKYAATGDRLKKVLGGEE